MRIRWRGLELPTRMMRDDTVSTPTYGKFVVEPFERGFGTTVGNSLRRILLSSLEGAAVTHVKIRGVDHEFTTIPGVLEDVTVLILNIKALVVRLTGDGPKTMRLSVQGKSGQSNEVRAAQIQADPAIEIINTDQLLATLTEKCDFEMEMTVNHGRSYATAEDNKPEGEDQVIGIIPVDSVFSPVTRVRYRVEDTRVGQRTNYDRLVLEIWTNGTITPEMALVEAAKILRKHLNPFVQYFELGSSLGLEKADAGMSGGVIDESKLNMTVAAMDLSVRANNCLASASINTVGQLIQMDELSLLQLRSFGKTSLREVKRKLADMGLSLRGSDGPSASDYDDDGDEALDGDLNPDGTYGSAPVEGGGTYNPVASSTFASSPPSMPPGTPTGNNN
jgi:DNA-directed RNA polymerase subunit alpha